MSSLKSGYNLKFITDIHGYAGMRKSILSIKPSQELKLLARKGILSSYTNIFRTLTKGGYPPSASADKANVGIRKDIRLISLVCRHHCPSFCSA